MTPTKWPPDWWTTVVGSLGPWDHKFFDGLIPLMDVRQFIYEFARELVDWIPHQGNEYSRPVLGTVGAVFSGGAKPFIPLGRVGYNAKTHKILWEVNRQGGPKQQAMYFDVQSAIPVIFQLLMMVPWNFVGEAEEAAQDTLKADQAPRAKDIVTWLYGKLRDGLSDIGIILPAMPGDYSSSGVSWSDIVIPAGTYLITNGPVVYPIIFSDTTIIKPKNSPDDAPQVFRGLASTTYVVDAALAPGNKVSLTLPETVLGRENLDVTIIGGTNGVAQVNATAAVRTIMFMNIDPVNTATIPVGSYNLAAGRVYPFSIDSAIPLPPLAIYTLTLIADTTGHDTTWVETGPVNMAQIQPLFPLTVVGTYIGGTNGLNAVEGRRASIDVSIVSKHAQAGMLLPTVSDLALYNIPVINFCQSVYEGAVELVNAIAHHGPAFTRPVVVGGVFPQFIFRVYNSAGDLLLSSSEAPQTADLVNNRLVVSVVFFEDDGHGMRPVKDGPDMERVLLDHTFMRQGTTIDFEATTDGPDTFFDIADDIALDQEEAIQILEAFSVTLDAYTKAVAVAEKAYSDAVEAVEGDINDPSVVEAQTAVMDAKSDLRLVTDRHTALARRTEQRDFTVIKADVALPATLNLPNVSGSIIAQEQGFAEVALSDGSSLQATKARFRISVQVEKTGSTTQGSITIPSSFPAFKPSATFGRRMQAVAATVGHIDIPMLAISSIPSLPWASVQIQGIVNSGLDAPDDVNEPGAERGRKPVVDVVVFNNTADRVTVTEKNTQSMFTFAVSGTIFVANTPSVPATVDAMSTKTYTGTPTQTELTDQVLAEADIAFSAPIPNTRAFVRWRKAADIDYIGEEFNISNPWQGANNGSAFRRYLQCKLRYKLYDRISSVTGEPQKAKNYTVVYTPTPKMVPQGNCMTMRIDYDAKRRLITVHNMRNNSSVTMHTNSAVWFMLQLLLLIPVEVI